MDDVDHRTRGCAGCLAAGVVGAVTALIAWAPLARVSVTGGFEQQHRDLSVLYVDLPLVALGGALVPAVAWALGLRLLGGRAWAAALVAVAALGVGVWGLTSWWTPYERPEFTGQATLVARAPAAPFVPHPA
ncbi:hypothetical protein ACH4NS_07905 [Streptomyces mutabilis]|uniref:hypothetical protein n=1 Tax=Streptomyces TaxID=1883 RepID=UPI000BCFF6DD|nr:MULTISPECIES: hypothetical protein [unclassified Streptomyces]MDG9694140.1 hypothetical protein [Streptomyces sp. DH17]MDN3246736.1 hypothetical protein [Streptomyces sp. ZSW22]MDN3254713.1 hypothetical protein [Streptomyces sp. MA25(2023)]MDQ0386457.1 hypothetical protein [Streptomyces sp. DSM 42143]PAK24572.1 hypothetical protein CJD44_21820 [Streptomyces sp. alain-838]